MDEESSRRKIYSLPLTKQDMQDLYTSVSMRISYIETGDVALCAQDAVRSGQPEKVNVLSEEQQAVVARLKSTQSLLLRFAH